MTNVNYRATICAPFRQDTRNLPFRINIVSRSVRSVITRVDCLLHVDYDQSRLIEFAHRPPFCTKRIRDLERPLRRIPERVGDRQLPARAPPLSDRITPEDRDSGTTQVRTTTNNSGAMMIFLIGAVQPSSATGTPDFLL